ncbi:MAG: cytochrome B [Rhodocyclaceae bacterium]|nr:MAG: cytochrome B [Rhodocyclaceae bacterium]
MSTDPQSHIHRIRLWDLPTRLFHWLLVAAIATAFVTGQLGGNLIAIHGKVGIAVVGLLAFRLVWGFIGSTPSRFFHFLPTPGRIRSYLKGQWQGHGHNPLGALSVFALLGLLALQSGSGLFTNDDIAFTGPLYSLIDEDLALRLTGWHKQLSWVLLGFLGLHLAAIVFYVRFKKDNLVKPMVTGWKAVPEDSAPAAHKGGGLLALTLALVVAATASYVATGAWLPQAPVAAFTTPAW